MRYKTTNQGSKWVDVLLTGDKRSVTISSLLANQNYNWQIRAKCGENWTEYSGAINFKTLAATSSSLSHSGIREGTSSVMDALKYIKAETILIYPNPTKGKFMLELRIAGTSNANAQIQLLDLMGRTVYSQNTVINKGMLQKEITVSSGLAKGMYIVRIMVNDKIYWAQLVYAK